MNKIAEVDAVFPDKVSITIYDLNRFCNDRAAVRVGTYIQILDHFGTKLIAMIESFSISHGNAESNDLSVNVYKVDARPLGTISNGNFERGSASLAIPPKTVAPADKEEIHAIFENAYPQQDQFRFSHLSSDESIAVPLEGNRFFNKHSAIVGSTGSGKSYTVSKIIQTAVQEGDGVNNSHVLIFDIHSEYHAAFPNANYLDVSNLRLPYWLMNGTELQELLLDIDENAYNQQNVFKEGVVSSKKKHFQGAKTEAERITFDSPVYFEIDEVLAYVKAKNSEMIQGANNKEKQGPLFGKLSNIISRFENRLNDRRLKFLLGKESRKCGFEDTLKQLLGYGEKNSNVTIIDVSGVPFEVLSITVSLISRIIFEYGYYYKRARSKSNKAGSNDIPVLLVYEEAHKYVPESGSAKYRSARESIERIAKEGRKYGVSLMLASQRPSEISETVFSQCNSFLALRLTNPNDQNYVKRLLPDSMGSIVDSLPTLRTGEALVAGEAVPLPCIVKIDRNDTPPASDDIPYWSLWQDKWHELDIDGIRKQWLKR